MINLDDTTRAIAELKELGQPITMRGVLGKLGRGSFTTMGRHFRKLGLIVDPVSQPVVQAVIQAESVTTPRLPADPEELKEWLGDKAKSINCVVVDSDHYDDLFESKGMLSETLYELKKLQLKNQAVKDSVVIDEIELTELRRTAGVVVRLRQRLQDQDAELDKLVAVAEILNRSDPAEVKVDEARRVLEG